MLASSISTRLAWADKPDLKVGMLRFSEHAHDGGADDPSVATIVDSGLTEIEPGTSTARVYLEQLL